MRERTPITKNLLDNLNKLKFIITSGLEIDQLILMLLKKNHSLRDRQQYQSIELTWALILGLARNLKEEIDNMYQGYWQTCWGRT